MILTESWNLLKESIEMGLQSRIFEIKVFMSDI